MPRDQNRIKNSKRADTGAPCHGAREKKRNFKFIPSRTAAPIIIMTPTPRIPMSHMGGAQRRAVIRSTSVADLLGSERLRWRGEHPQSSLPLLGMNYHWHHLSTSSTMWISMHSSSFVWLLAARYRDQWAILHAHKIFSR